MLSLYSSLTCPFLTTRVAVSNKVWAVILKKKSYTTHKQVFRLLASAMLMSHHQNLFINSHPVKLILAHRIEISCSTLQYAIAPHIAHIPNIDL